MGKQILVRVDLYGEQDPIDFWEAFIYNLTHDEFMAIFNKYEHDRSNDIRGTWANHLEKHEVIYKPLVFDIDQKLEW